MEEYLKKSLVHSKEEIYLALAIVFSISTYILLAFSVIGIIIIFIIGLVSYFFHAINIAHIRRNAVRISPQQFPNIYEKAEKLALEMGLKQVPSMYVMESMGILNAFATRFFGKNMVVMYSEIFDLIESDKEDEMMFVLAHEFAHLKRSHVIIHLLILPAMWVPFLGEAYMRACEYTCDRYGAFYIKNMEAAQNALTILAIGKKLQYRVNKEAFVTQLEEEKGFFMWLSEKLSTHPHLPKRMNNLNHWKNPQDHKLFKERKRNLVVGLLLAFVLFPAVIFGTIYAIEQTDAFADIYSEEVFDDDYYEVEYDTVLMNVSGENNLEGIKKELENGADLEAVDSDGYTALHWAVLNDANDAVKLLISNGSKVNAINYEGETALHLAVMNGNSEVVELLLDNNADQTIEDWFGSTALDLAKEYRDYDLVELLTK